MATTYNHKAVEKKWICSRIRQEAVFMSVTGEVM